MLYAHDGMGMGHLRRIARIAAALSTDFSTVVLSGMREATWIVEASSGLMKLPDWDGLDRDRAERAGQRPWVDLSPDEARAFRSRAILDAARLYRPDAFIVDYLPMGQRRELQSLLETLPCPRYLIHRGIADSSDSFALGGAATREIAEHYDRILVASDKRLGDVAVVDHYCPEARAVTRYVGFVTAPPQPLDFCKDRHVVCSAGGGFQAEDMMLECLETARRNPSIPFHVVLGPRSRLKATEVDAPANCDVRQQRDDLPDLHRNAAVVVSAGGYNSILEAAFGGARIIVHPNSSDDEQTRFAKLLSAHHPVQRLERLENLEPTLLLHWEAAAAETRAAPALDSAGDQAIRSIISDDLAAGYRSPHLRTCGPPIVSLDGFRMAAQARLAKEVFDYIDGGAGDELTRRANREAFDAVRLSPLVFRDVASVDARWSSSLGEFKAPIGISPMALHRLVNEHGEIATARAAHAAGVPMIVSMMASCSIEEIASQSQHPDLWLQIYVLEDRGLGRDLVRRAEAAGYKAIVVTAGCPVMGKRDRNLLNRFTLPASLAPANFGRTEQLDHNNPIHSFAGGAIDATATWDDVAAIAAETRLPLLVKGIVNSDDVAPALASGAAGILVSNHGGRQLDGTESSLRALAAVAEAAAGKVPLLLDGGIRRGADVAKAIALGADGAFVGSPILWALALDGEHGVVQALDILAREFENALALLGCPDIAALRRDAPTIVSGGRRR